MDTESSKNFKKKLIGSAVFFLLLGAMALATSAPVKALFVDTGKILNIDAAVISVGSSNLVIDTPGTPSMTVDVSSKTVFTGASSLSDIAAGDTVRITARTSGDDDNPIALVIRKTGTGYGYGAGSDNVVVTDAKVTGKTADTFTVETKSLETITFKVLSSTIFTKGDFSTLKIGDKVLVNGDQTSTEFIARTVVVKSKGKPDDGEIEDVKGSSHEDKGKSGDKEKQITTKANKSGHDKNEEED